MTESQKISLRRSEVRQRLNELSGVLEPSDEQAQEMDSLTTEFGTLERRYRAAVIAETADAEEAAREIPEDGEARERRELREKALLATYFEAFSRGRVVGGAEAELAAAYECRTNEIPFVLFEMEPEREQRDISPAPSTVGVNLQPIRPAVFAPSILPRLGVDMPVVPSGTYAEGTITTSAVPAAVAKSSAVSATAQAITVSTTTPKRVAARLEVTLEDVAAIGTSSFESMLRQNIALALSDELDDQGLNGNGTAPNLSGLFQALTDPSAPAAAVETFDRFVAIFAGGIDGKWARNLKEVAVVCGVETYRLAAQTFRDASADLGEIAVGDYLANMSAGFWTNARMPAKVSHVQQGILYRMGRRLEGGSRSMRTAVCPIWSRGVGIDDIYSGSAKGERYYTLSALVGDVLLVQSDAYAQVNFRVSTA